MMLGVPAWTPAARTTIVPAKKQMEVVIGIGASRLLIVVVCSAKGAAFRAGQGE
jgi:hypothetical protein